MRTCAIPERLRGVFTTGRYTNPRLPYLTLLNYSPSRKVRVIVKADGLIWFGAATQVMDRLESDGSDRQLSIMFVEKYLRRDGVFVLKLVAKNSTDLVVADIVAALYDNFRRKPGVLPGVAAPNVRRPSAPGLDDDQGGDDGDKV